VGSSIRSNGTGLALDGARGISITSNRVVSNTAFGLFAKGVSTGTNVTGNTISGNGTNIDTKAATGGTFQTS
jgi:parallel beta-helix repeat protein